MKTLSIDDQVVEYLASNNTSQKIKLDSDHVLTLNGQGYEDLKPTGEYSPNGAAAPTVKNVRGNHYLPAFSGTGTNEKATYRYHLPHDYVENSAFYLHVHWLNNNASPTGAVQWKAYISYARGYEDGAFANDLTVNLPLATVNSTQYTHHITESVAINNTDFTGSPILRTDGCLIITIERDTSDTNNDDAFMIEVDIHYLSDGRKTVEKNDTGSGFTKV